MSVISETMRKEYQTNGFVRVNSAIDLETVHLLRDEWSALWQSIDLTNPPRFVHWRDKEDGSRVADRLDPVHTQSAVFRNLCESPAIRSHAELLLGGSVFVLKDKLISKKPGTTGYGAHQDMPYWETSGLSADDVLTVAISLDEVSVDHGPIELFAGRHRSRLEADSSGLDLSEAALKSIGTGYPALMSSGDALYFHSLVPHRSGTNQADTARRLYLITFARDSGNKEQALRAYQNDLARVHTAHQKEKPIS
ncbi:MAG: phytanoyl-CoA dioxygenase family protein [Henriciella sp.]